MTTKIIFLCPHNAAKSVAAAAFLQRLATDKDLDVEITTAGTDPDPIVHTVVRARLEAEGLPAEFEPRKVTAEDLSTVDVIVNIGCGELPTSKSVQEWNIPNFSDDAVMAFEAIEIHVAGLALQLNEAG